MRLRIGRDDAQMRKLRCHQSSKMFRASAQKIVSGQSRKRARLPDVKP